MHVLMVNIGMTASGTILLPLFSFSLCVLLSVNHCTTVGTIAMHKMQHYYYTLLYSLHVNCYFVVALIHTKKNFTKCYIHLMKYQN